MQAQLETTNPQKVSVLNPIFLEELRSQKRKATPHLKVTSSLINKNKFNKISRKRRNALLDPLKIHFYIIDDVFEEDEIVLL